MKYVILITVSLLACLNTCNAQLNVTFLSFDWNEWPLLTTYCENSEPIPDGFPVQIFVDNGTPGPSLDDVQPPVGAGVGYVSFNTFSMNGCNEIGECGLFISAPMTSDSFLANQKFYLRVKFWDAWHLWTYWYSETHECARTADFQDLFFTHWTCDQSMCKTDCICASLADDSVMLVPDNYPWPAPQTVSECVRLASDLNTILSVPVMNATNVPQLNIQPGCATCAEPTCVPLLDYVLGDWSLDTLTSPVNFPDGSSTNLVYTTSITKAHGAYGCCVCVSLDYMLPVDFTGIQAVPGDGSVAINWTTASETNLAHYEVMRNHEQIATVNLDPDRSYTYTDERVLNGTTYNYQIIARGINGEQTESAEVEATPRAGLGQVAAYRLLQNYPNPFNPTTQIQFDLKEEGWVTLKVFNIAGQEVSTLVNHEFPQGRHAVTFDGSGLPSALYMYKLETGNFSAVNKMLLMK